MSERYINNLTGDFSICFSEHLTGHPSNIDIHSYEIGQWEKEISDHRPQIIEI